MPDHLEKIEYLILSLKEFNEIQESTDPLIYALLDELENCINKLIQKDFNKLISILYRIDINEEKLKEGLAKELENQSAGRTIAQLIFKRQQQKFHLRAKHSKEQ